MSTTLRFLGTAAATPIPQAACECAQCGEARRARNLRRLRSAIVVEGPAGALLVDAGPDIYRQLGRLPALPAIGAAIITHAHSDHFMGLDDLASLGRARGRPLPIYAAADNWPRIEAAFGHLFRAGPSRVFEARTLALDTAQQIAGVEVRPFDSSHSTEMTTAMLAFDLGDQKVIYAPDLKVMPRAVFAGAGVAIIGGTFYQREHPAHMPLVKAIRACRRAGVQRVIVTHVGHLEMSNAELWAHLSEQGADLAYDGATLVFD